MPGEPKKEQPKKAAEEPVQPTKEPAVVQETPKVMKEEADDEPVITSEPVEEPEKAKAPASEEDAAAKQLVELEDKVTQLKERGNMHFKKRNYKDAIKAFSEAYNAFVEARSPRQAESLTTKVSQVLTNRSLAFHSLNQQASALSDATIVLTQFDPKNPKALFRRAHAYKAQEKWEDAVRDLQVLMKEAPTDAIKKDLDTCMSKFVAARKAQAEKEAAKPKI